MNSAAITSALLKYRERLTTGMLISRFGDDPPRYCSIGCLLAVGGMSDNAIASLPDEGYGLWEDSEARNILVKRYGFESASQVEEVIGVNDNTPGVHDDLPQVKLSARILTAVKGFLGNLVA